MAVSQRASLASSVPVPKASTRTTRSTSKQIQKQQEAVGVGSASVRSTGGNQPLTKRKLGAPKDAAPGHGDHTEDPKIQDAAVSRHSMRISSAPSTSNATSSRLPRTHISSRISTMAAEKRSIYSGMKVESTKSAAQATPTRRGAPSKPKQRLETAEEVTEEDEPVEKELSTNISPTQELATSTTSRLPRNNLPFRMPVPLVRQNLEASGKTTQPIIPGNPTSIRKPSALNARMGHQRSVSAFPSLPSAVPEVSSRVPTRVAAFAKPQIPTPRKVVPETTRKQQTPTQRLPRMSRIPPPHPEPKNILLDTGAAENTEAASMSRRPVVEARKPGHLILTEPFEKVPRRQPVPGKTQAPSGLVPTNTLPANNARRTRTDDWIRARVDGEIPITGGDQTAIRAPQASAAAQTEHDAIAPGPSTPHPRRQAQYGRRRPPGESSSPPVTSPQPGIKIVDRLPLPRKVSIANVGKLLSPLMRVAPTTITTPSRIPRLTPAHAGRFSTTPESVLGHVVSPATTAKAASSPPERIIFPTVAEAELNTNATGKNSPIPNAVPKSARIQHVRTRKDSNTSDIDDKLRQSMLRLPRTSGLSPGWSPRSVLDPDSGRKAKHGEGRTTKQSPLANVTLSTRVGERSVLASRVNETNIDTPIRPNGNTRLRNAGQLFTPDTLLHSRFQQVNESLEQENLSLAFELVALEAQAAQAEAARREAEMAGVWKEIASGLRVELAQLQREKAMRKREMEKIDVMVELAILGV